jgi:flagellar FliL protein
MAAEEKKEAVAAEEPKKGKSFVKIIIIVFVILILLAALGVGGLIAWKKYIAPAIGMAPHEGGAAAKKEKEEEGVVAHLGPMFPLEPFIVNLAEPGGKRFIKITMEMELGGKELEEEFKNKLPQFKDHIITVLSSKTMDEVITAEGKFKLKEEIMARVNQNLKSGVVKNVFFTEFVVQ